MESFINKANPGNNPIVTVQSSQNFTKAILCENDFQILTPISRNNNQSKQEENQNNDTELINIAPPDTHKILKLTSNEIDLTEKQN